MRHIKGLRHDVRLPILSLALALLAAPAFAGLSQPGMVLVGSVYDTSHDLLTQGKLTVTFTPSAGGKAITRTASLAEIMGPAGALSYSILIPLEMAAKGSPVSSAALAITATPTAYTRVISVDGTAISRSDSVMISTAGIGSVSRVDVPKEQSGSNYHSGDVNQDYHFSLLELLREIELYTSTAGHAYHCDSLGEDGFDTGSGEQTCTPHSGDYAPQDWKFSSEELLREIELFSATPEHAYHVDAAGPDGFAPNHSGAKAMESGDASTANTALLSMRRITTTVSDTESEVTVAFNGPGNQPVTAMGLEEQLPAGAAFERVVAGDKPSVVSNSEKDGRVFFAWLYTPQGGGSFTYRVRTSHAAAPIIEGKSLHRVRGVRDTVRNRIVDLGLTVRPSQSAESASETASVSVGAEDVSDDGMLQPGDETGEGGYSEEKTVGAESPESDDEPQMPLGSGVVCIAAIIILRLALRRILKAA